MSIAQPYIEQEDADQATEADVTAFMSAHGFALVDQTHIAIPVLAPVTWYRQTDGILITDAFPRNFRKASTTGALIPIDLVVSLVPPGSSLVLLPTTKL